VLNYLEKVVDERVHEMRRKTMEAGLEAGLRVIYPHSGLRLAMRDLVMAGLNQLVNSGSDPTAPCDPMGLTSVSLALGS
jgi:hypothetical protein